MAEAKIQPSLLNVPACSLPIWQSSFSRSEFVCKAKDTVFVYFLHPNNLDPFSDLFGVFLCLRQFVIFYFHFLTTADQNKAIYASSIESEGVEW